MTTNPKTMAEIKNELRDPSLHFRPECEGFRCGANKSWDEGFDARDKLDNEALKIAVEALEHIYKIQENRSVHIPSNCAVIREALAAIQKITIQK